MSPFIGKQTFDREVRLHAKIMARYPSNTSGASQYLLKHVGKTTTGCFFLFFISQLTGFKASRDVFRSFWHSSEIRRVVKALDGQRRLESAHVSGSLKCKRSQVFPKQLFKRPHRHGTGTGTGTGTVKSENTLVLLS